MEFLLIMKPCITLQSSDYGYSPSGFCKSANTQNKRTWEIRVEMDNFGGFLDNSGCIMAPLRGYRSTLGCHDTLVKNCLSNWLDTKIVFSKILIL